MKLGESVGCANERDGACLQGEELPCTIIGKWLEEYVKQA